MKTVRFASARIALLISTFGVFAFPCGWNPALAQTNGQGTTPAAVHMAVNAVVLTGGDANTQTQPCVARGTLKYDRTPNTKYPVIYYSIGRRLLRVETQHPTGTYTFIMNGNKALGTKSDGISRLMAAKNSVASRPTHLPFLSLLAESANPDFALRLSDPQIVDGVVYDEIDISPANNGGRRDPPLQKILVNRSDGLIHSLSFRRYSENYPSEHQDIEIIYSDYRSMNSALVPFRQDTLVNGKHESTLLLDSVDLHATVPTSMFAGEVQ
jgi:hypothetical protein